MPSRRHFENAKHDLLFLVGIGGFFDLLHELDEIAGSAFEYYRSAFALV